MAIKHEDAKVQLAGVEIATHLTELERLFKPGVKLTFLARFPDKPEQDMCITSDKLDAVLAMVQRRKDAES